VFNKRTTHKRKTHQTRCTHKVHKQGAQAARKKAHTFHIMDVTLWKKIVRLGSQ
jgi:hypothetical protein